MRMLSRGSSKNPVMWPMPASCKAIFAICAMVANEGASCAVANEGASCAVANVRGDMPPPRLEALRCRLDHQHIPVQPCDHLIACLILDLSQYVLAEPGHVAMSMPPSCHAAQQRFGRTGGHGLQSPEPRQRTCLAFWRVLSDMHAAA